MAGYNFSQNIIGLNKTNGDIHELEVEVETLNTYQHTEVTLTSGIVTEFGRMGNECILKFGDGSTNAEFVANSSLGTVPAGYVPIMPLDLRDTSSSKRIIIDTNGSITARESIPEGSFIRGSFTYIGKLPT